MSSFKHSITIILALFSVVFLVFSFSNTNTNEIIQDEEELANCLIKAKSEWGKKCLNCGEFNGYHLSYDDTYKIFLTNQCDYHVDVKCCVQEEDGSWKCYHYEDMTPKDTMEAWACIGTGKYLKWVKLAGDHELVFPTNEEVQEQYPASEKNK